MRYNDIFVDIANGPGVRVSVFFQGCSKHCKGCFNELTWDFCSGKELTEEVRKDVLTASSKDEISGLSILGGEPLEQPIDELISLLTEFKELNPHKTIWMWTGFTYEELMTHEMMELKKTEVLFDLVDVLIDGSFVEELKNPSLVYMGSDNQRIIDLKATKNNNTLTLLNI